MHGFHRSLLQFGLCAVRPRQVKAGALALASFLPK